MHAQNITQIDQSLPTATTSSQYYGSAVDMDGNYSVVGSYGHNLRNGRVYVLHFDGNNWITEAVLTASDAENFDGFGWSVSISGDNVVVGSYGDDDGGSGSGSAYVFTKPSSGWTDMTETAKLTASDASSGNSFGWSVAVLGDHIAVSAQGGNGSVYVFDKPLAGWSTMTETGKLTASDGASSDKLGTSLSMSGDYIVAGSPYDDDIASNTGSAYIFSKPVSGWTSMNETAKLTSSDATQYDYFGYAVSISGDNIVVGAYNDDDNSADSGSAYVFSKPSAGWISMTETAKLTSSDASVNDYFGKSVSISGDNILVGCHGNDDDGEDSGSAYVFIKPSTGWINMTENLKLTASDGALGDSFGKSVSISGGNMVIGAYHDDNNGSNSGSAYYFSLSTGLTGTHNETVCFGESVIVNGTVYDANNLSGTEVFTNVGPQLQDSTVTVNLTILPELTGTHIETVCFGESITVNGTIYDINNLSGVEVFSNIGANSCDSTVSVNLTILPEINGVYNETVCFGESIMVNGTVYDASNMSGIEAFSNSGVNGCDSMVTVTLTIIDAIDLSTSISGLTISSDQVGATYQWLDCDYANSEIIGAIEQSYTATVNGNYSVVITKDGCTDTSSCVNINTVGINENILSNELSVYPNPTKDKITIVLDHVESGTEISVFTTLGKNILTKKITSNQTVIGLRDFETGIYLVQIRNGKSVTTKRIVKH